MIRLPALALAVFAGLPASATAINANSDRGSQTLGNAAQQQVTMSSDMCGERDSMVRQLSDRFGERHLATGMMDRTAVMEIFVSDGGTWTMLATGTDGVSCVMAVGEGFQAGATTVGAEA